MSARKDGGPAFPVPRSTSTFENQGGEPLHYGMTLRDWFAGQALAAIITATSEGLHSPGAAAERAAGAHENTPIGHLMASDAYAMADAMLAAREVAP